MYSPMAAFAVPRDGGAIRSFAIQCGQDPAGREIYTPDDGYSWKLAKNCVLVAHNTYHGEITHLGLTHLVSEAVLLAAVRTSRRCTPSRCCCGATSRAPCRSTSSRSSC